MPVTAKARGRATPRTPARPASARPKSAGKSSADDAKGASRRAAAQVVVPAKGTSKSRLKAAEAPAVAKVRPTHAPQPAAAPAVGRPSQSTFAKAVRFLDSLADFERLRIVRYNAENFDLGRMRALLKKLGNPHEQFRSVHIAGTKGKGSTSTMLATMLRAQGLRVGLYTSPHLVDLRERIAVDGTLITEGKFGEIVRRIEPIAQKLKPSPTYFDVLTAAAFVHFAEEKVDIAVVETGLGGRLDSTNVLKPEVCAITSIGIDHTQQLGHTLAKIAAEKAGIFKPGVPAVTVVQHAEADATLKRVAAEAGAPLDVCGGDLEFSYRFETSRAGGRMYRVCLNTPNSKFDHVVVPLLGEHQAVNCGLALAVLDKLKGRGLPIDDQKAVDALAGVKLHGRMELYNKMPRVLVDAAHNASSMDALMKAVGQHVPYDSMVVIFGCCADKDCEAMLQRIAAGADKAIFLRVNNVRSANPHELAARYTEQYGKMAQVAGDLREALEIAMRACTKEDLITITGSFYLVGEAKKLLTGPSTWTVAV